MRRILKPRLALLAGLLIIGFISSTASGPLLPPPSGREAWADSVLGTMTLKEQVGQLITIAVYPNKDLKHEVFIDSLVTFWKPGGIIVFQGAPAKSSQLVARWQQMSKLPLLVSMDAEWGPSMRLDSLPYFPRQMTLGAIRNDSLIRLMGKEIGRQLAVLGVNLSYSPVVDVNSNSANPVINSRSFGENPGRVSTKGIAYMQGLHDAGILACAKHFPGHGDTEKDSHVTLPVVNASKAVLDSIHLMPFRSMVGQGVDLVMTAHIQVPALDNRSNRPATLSAAINKDLLRKEMGFSGVVVTDALNMKGIADYYTGAQLIVEAMKAGTDILLMPNDVGLAVNAILESIGTGKLDSISVANSCRRILMAKYDAGLSKTGKYKYRPNASAEISTEYSKALISQLYQSALILLKNDSLTLPYKNGARTAIVNIGGRNPGVFSKQLGLFVLSSTFELSSDPGTESLPVIAQLDSFDRVIINIHASSISASRNYGITESGIALIKQIADKKPVVLNIAANPYILKSIPDHTNIKAVLICHEDRTEALRAAALAIGGASDVNGQMPVSAGKYREGFGIELKCKGLSFTNPYFGGIPIQWMARIDSIVEQSLVQNAFPGCQVLIAQNGKIFYHKSFGSLNYEETNPVDELTLYDIASVTKVAASSLAIMKLYEEGKIDVDQNLGYYLPELKGSNKEKLIIRDVLTHQARLKAWIPFYKETLPINDNPIYSKSYTSTHSIQVSEGLYIRNDYRDTLYQRLIKSELEPTKRYLYSDLGYFFMQRIIESVGGMDLESFVNKNFYEPMGLAHLGYNPLQCFPMELIAPTENDTYYRFCLVRGYVHDQGAAMLGGKAGHAGLFSNTYDLAVIMQMLLDGGTYAGQRYLKESTIKEFTKQQFPLEGNRRGLVFDRPNPMGGGQVADEASERSFGHSGFTGSFVWDDPANGMVYVFLSNRVYPDANNQTINRLETRRQIQSMAYQAMAARK